MSEILERMETLEITQSHLAEECGVSQQMINFICNGKRMPSLALALKIAHVLGCAVEDLFPPPS